MRSLFFSKFPRYIRFTPKRSFYTKINKHYYMVSIPPFKHLNSRNFCSKNPNISEKTELNDKPKQQSYIFTQPEPDHRIYSKVSNKSFKRTIWIERIIVLLILACVLTPLSFIYYYYDGTVPYTKRKRFLILPIWLDDIIGYYTLNALNILDKNEKKDSQNSQTNDSNKNDSITTGPSTTVPLDHSNLTILDPKTDYKAKHVQNIFFHILKHNYLYQENIENEQDKNENIQMIAELSKLDAMPSPKWDNIDLDSIIPKKSFKRFIDNFNWKLFLIDSLDSCNAMCTPGGKMVIYTGILRETVGNDSDCAAIICHEISHAIARHGIENLQFTFFGITCFYLIISSLGLDISWILEKIIMWAIYTMFRLPMNRKYELEADEISVYLMINSGFNPNSLVNVLEQLNKLQKQNSITPPEILSTHPVTEKRIQKLEETINKIYNQNYK